MRTLTTLALALPLFALAQTDSTRKEAEGTHSLFIGTNGTEGFEVRVDPIDTTHRDKPDTLRITMGSKLYTIITTRKVDDGSEDQAKDRERQLARERRNQFTYWSGIDLGFNTYLDAAGSLELDSTTDFMELDPWASRFLSINFMEQKIGFGSHHAGLLTGLGIEFTSYKLANNVILGYDKDSTYATEVESPTFTKNKLRQIGLRVPLMLEFNTGRAEVVRTTGTSDEGEWVQEHIRRENNFHIAAGVVGTVYFDTMYKQKYRQDGEMQKERSGGTYNLLPYRLAASVRVGYGSFNLFAEYGLTHLFKEDRGPELTPLNVGITLIGFN